MAILRGLKILLPISFTVLPISFTVLPISFTVLPISFTVKFRFYYIFLLIYNKKELPII